jgi:hypothetical protein
MDEQRKTELADIIGSLESRLKHYTQVSERQNADERARAFTSAFNDFEYSIQILRAIRDDRGFDMEDEDE